MNCGVYCIVFVHREHGKKISLTRATRLAKPNRNGTSPAHMIAALEKLGYRAKLKENISWTVLRRYLRNGNTVIPAWWSDLDAGDKRPIALPADGHWSVIINADRYSVKIYDPDAPTPRHLPRKFFEARWYDYYTDEEGIRHDLHSAALIVKKKRTV